MLNATEYVTMNKEIREAAAAMKKEAKECSRTS